MPEFFNYDELTWPEVAALPRDTPLLLPLGSGYDFNQVVGRLGNPARIGLLPPFPFGWIGSGLEVPKIILGRCVGNLITCLRNDGFTAAYCVTPDDGSGIPYFQIPGAEYQIALPSSATGVRNGTLLFDSDRDKVVLIPIGHTEQHALHLPLSVDTCIIEAIAQGTVDRAPARSCTLPVMPYGVSMHRSSFAGTLSAGGRSFEDFWLAVIDALVATGFNRFYLMSGHGGNMSFLVNIVKYAGDRHHRIFCATAFLHTSGPLGVAALEKYRTSKIGGMGHACELETSFMLHLRPELCHMDRVVDETDFITTPSYYMDWIEGGALIANPPWDDDTRTGAYGAGSQATASKGQLWLESAIQEKVQHVEEIHEQQERREARRNAGFGLWASASKDDPRGA